MRTRALLALMLFGWASMARSAGQDEYAKLQERLARGWNTWDTRNVLVHEHLPGGEWFAPEFRLGEDTVKWAQPGHWNHIGLDTGMGVHSIDGQYSQATLNWHGFWFTVETANIGDNCVMLITPIPLNPPDPHANAVRVHFLEGAPAVLTKKRAYFVDGGTVKDLPDGDREYALTGPVVLSTGKWRPWNEALALVRSTQKECTASWRRAGVPSEMTTAVGSTLGWDTIYDPSRNRVMTPVSRAWNVNWGGWVLFDWDTFFAGYTAGFFSRDLAYANVIEILRESTPDGFVPNYASARLPRSLDRSEPPVGSLVVSRLYRRFHDRWFVEEAFPGLLAWNRWWAQHRVVDGYMAWGSDPSDPAYDQKDGAVNTLQGAKYESGLDNSPMYDGAPFDSRTHRMQLADVGLMGLYVADCDALAQLADVLGKKAEAVELRERSARISAKLATLWDESRGLYLNRNLVTGAASPRISPTNFYPLLTGVPTPAQARRMIREHLFNLSEFWGEWVFPSTPRNDPAFHDQFYWRGRIWAPMNQLLYWGLERYGTPDERRPVAQKSAALLLKDWRARGQVHENYNTILGTGDDVTSSDPFYSWGALLGVLGWDGVRSPDLTP